MEIIQDADFFKLEKWKIIREKVSNLTYANSEKELQIMMDQNLKIKENLVQLIQILINYYQQQPGTNKNIENHEFFLDNLPSMIKDMQSRKNYLHSDVYDQVDEILNLYVQFLAVTINLDNQILVESFKNVFEISKPFYKLNNQDEEGLLPFGKNIEEDQQRIEWLNSLKVDDLIDAIKVNKDYSKACWSRAKIIEKNEQLGDVTIKISFLCEENTYDREIFLKGQRRHYLAPYQSMTPDFEKRMNLQQGDIIDVADPQNVWYNSTIKSVRNEIVETGEIKLVEIGYRVYREDGHSKDPENQLKYQGWSAKYDEELCVTNPRIQLKDTMAKKFYLKASARFCESFIDDSQDIIYNDRYKQEKFYALPRPKVSKSLSLINYINTFGKAGGFQNILERIGNKENWLNIELLNNYMTALGSISGMLSRQFSFEFMPKFQETVINNIIQSPDYNIRNMNFDLLQSIKVNLGDLIKRGHYSIGEKREIMEKFLLQLSILCFKSSFIQQKVNGLKIINDLVDKVINKSNDIAYLNNALIEKWLVNNNIFDIVFDKDTAHTQLIQRSIIFLKFMLKQDIISQNQIEQIWEILDKCTHKDLQQQIFTVIEGVSQEFSNDHVEILIRKISEIKPEKLTQEYIEIVYEISKDLDKESMALLQTYSFLWHLVCVEGNNVTEQVLDIAIRKFGFLASKIENQQQKYSYLKDCIKNLSQNKSVSVSIKLFKQIIDSFPSTQKINCDTQSKALKKLIDEENLINIIVDNIKLIKQSYKQKESQNAIDESNYNDRIQGRISFIKYVYSKLDIEDQNMSLDFLKNLWQMMVIDAVNNAEKDIIYQWFISLDKQKHLANITVLFRDIMFKIEDTEFLKNLSELGFLCFKSIFLAVNLEFQNITEIKLINKEVKYNNQGQVISISSNGTGGQNPQDVDFKYQMNRLPTQLSGMNILWFLILNANDDKVLSKSGELITKLYTNLSSAIEDQTQKIRQDFVDYVYAQLESIDLKQENKVQLELQLNTVLYIFKQFIGESEKKGTGGLISHSGIVKGDLVNIKIKNEVNILGQQKKDFDLKVNSNITYLELKKKICQKINIGWQDIKVNRSSNLEGSDIVNGKTLSDIRIKQNETLTILRRSQLPLQRVSLVDSNKQLLPKPKLIFTKWFNEYSVEGKMDKLMCAKFINSCVGTIVTKDDDQVAKIFAQNDKDQDGFLVLEDFLNLYQNFINQEKTHEKEPLKLETVWSNLKNKGYREDLKHVTEQNELDQKIQLIPRYMLIQKQNIYTILFDALQNVKNKKISLFIWEFLNSLPTDPKIVEKVKEFQGVKNNLQNPDWSQIFDQQSNFQLLYTLQIIEFLMQDNQQDDQEQQDAQLQLQEGDNNAQPQEIIEQERQLQNKINQMEEEKEEVQDEQQIFIPIEKDPKWRSDFILYGGFEQLFIIFTKIFQKNLNELDLLDKNILSFIFRIMKTYLVAAFHPYVPDIYILTMYTQQFNYSLDEVEQHMQEIQQEKQEMQVESEQQDEQQKKQPQQINDIYDIKKKRIKETKEFQQLSNVLKGDLGDKIIQTLDLSKLRKELTQKLTKFLQQIQENFESKPIKAFTLYSNLENEEKAIIEDILIILMSLLLHSEICLEEFTDTDQQESQKFIFLGLFFKVQASIRKMFTKFIYQLAQYKQEIFLPWIMNILIQNVPTSNDELRSECTQYYDILCKLIQKGSQNVDFKFNFSLLQKSVIESIVNYKSEEKRTRMKKDNILSGFLNLCEILFRIEPELAKNQKEFLFYIFDHLLFAKQPEIYAEKVEIYKDGILNTEVEDSQYVKCKSPSSRAITYKIFNHLVKQNQEVLPELIKNYFYPFTQTIPQQTGWNYLPSKHVKSASGYIGIKNLSNICYMNAMMQQFYMTSAFRYGVMAIDDKKEENIVEYEGRAEYNGNKLDDNIIHQMQRLFSYLELSDRADYNPYQFCFSFKDYQNKPVNVGVQQDAQEFLNQIFDKLDNGLKNNPWRYLLQGVYAGKLSSQLVCQGCNNIKEKFENFYNLSLTVKNMNSLQESLKHMIEGEVINDYYCEKCEKKQDTTKRVLLNSLPNVLIIHLQRIVFDLDTLMNQKISQKLEFPQILNLQPYTQQQIIKEEEMQKSKLLESQKENLKELEKLTLQSQGSSLLQAEASIQQIQELKQKQEQEQKSEPLPLNPQDSTIQDEKNKQKVESNVEFEYKLKGVVVHNGGADYGHYYSYIKTNDQENRWKEFNDSTIRDFQVKDLEKECFGGLEGDMKDDYQQLNKQEKSKNAYMLVYEKIQKKPIEFLFDDEKQKEEVLTSLQVDKDALQCQIVDIKDEDEQENEKKENNEIQDIKEKKDNKKIQVKLNYENIKTVIPKKLYQDVWIDNHKFMLEKQTYSEEYFEFLLNFVKSVDYPQDFQICQRETFDSFIPQPYMNFKKLTTQQQNIYIELLEMLHQQTFTHLVRANDNKTIKQIVLVIRDLIDLLPNYNWLYFQKYFLSDIKNIFEKIILKCPDSQVRNSYAKIILYLINTTINNYSLTLNPIISEQTPNYEQEKTIQELLQYILSILKTQAASAWVNERNAQYQELIKNFIQSGPTQLKWAFDNQMIGRLTDLVLGNNSTIKDYGEPVQMGNEHAQASIKHSVEAISYMALRAFNVVEAFQQTEQLCLKQQIDYQQYPKFTLSDNDKLGLSNIYFYEKCLLDNVSPDQVGLLVCHQCYQNRVLSQQMAYMLLPSFNKNGVDDLTTTLSLIGYYIMTQDDILLERFELLFGYPQLVRVTDTSKDYALYRPLHQQTIDYLSTMSEEQYYTHQVISYNQKIKSILSQLYSTSLCYTNLTIQTLRYILEVVASNQQLLQLFGQIPPPSPLYSRYLDWIKPFVLQYQAEAINEAQNGGQILALKMNKVETANKCMELIDNVLFQFEQLIQKQANLNLEDKINLDDILDPTYIVGKTVEVIEKDRQILKTINDNNVIRIEKDYVVNLLKSKPDPVMMTNQALPQQFINQEKKTLITKNIADNSNIFKIYSLEDQPPPLNINNNSYDINQINLDNKKEKMEVEKLNDEQKQKLEGNLPDNNNNQIIPLQDQEALKQIVTLDGIFEAQYIKVIAIKNESDKKLELQSQIIQQSNNFNIIGPRTSVNTIIPPYSIQNVITMHKILPELDFGEYQFILHLKEIEEENTSNQNAQVPDEEAAQFQNQDIAGPYSVVPVGPQNKDMTVSNTDVVDLQPINCPVCTYENYGYGLCDMCGSQLK